MEQSADYVIAGAGSAGCVLARRLAQTGASVILLEAGGPDRTRLVRKPGMIAILHNVPALKKRLDWGYYTAPQTSALGRKIPQPRGRVLGGFGRQLLRAPLVSMFAGQRLRALTAKESAEDLEAITGLIESCAVTPVIDRAYALADAPDAIRYLAGGHAAGKVVVTV